MRALAETAAWGDAGRRPTGPCAEPARCLRRRRAPARRRRPRPRPPAPARRRRSGGDEEPGGDRADGGEPRAGESASWSPSTYACGEPPNAASAGTSAPSAATPTAIPAWRNVSFTPAATPLCSLETVPSATAVSAGLNSPVPISATIAPGRMTVHDESTSASVNRTMPTATSASPPADHDPRGDLRAERARRAADEQHRDRARQVHQPGLDRRQARGSAAGTASCRGRSRRTRPRWRTPRSAPR